MGWREPICWLVGDIGLGYWVFSSSSGQSTSRMLRYDTNNVTSCGLTADHEAGKSQTRPCSRSPLTGSSCVPVV